MIGDLFKYWTYQVFSPGTILREKYESFKRLLEYDQLAHERMAELQRICYEALPVDYNRIFSRYNEFSQAIDKIVEHLTKMCPGCYSDLKGYYTRFDQYIRFLLAQPEPAYQSSKPFIIPLSEPPATASGQTGGKAHALIKIRNQLAFPVPKGFVITVNSFWHLIEHNRLQAKIDESLASIHPDDPSSMVLVSKELTAAIMQCEFPPHLKTAIEIAGQELVEQCGDRLRLAVRSSAVGEDSEITFAGQYRSCLQVPPAELLEAYRRVLASKFEPSALYYRIRSGLEDKRTPMAVVVMEMIDPLLSGVLYTRGPTPDKADMISIHYVEGLGEALVSGQTKANMVSVPHSPIDQQFLPDQFETETNDTGHPAMGASVIAGLTRWARLLENLMQTPCDVEWCLDKSKRMHLLQCRPLKQQKEKLEPSPAAADQNDTATPAVLFQGGTCACAGQGGGPVFRIENEDDLSRAPDRCVALLTNAPPHYIPILDRACAVIIETGSVAGHFQAVAREFNIPTLVDAHGAGSVIKQGEPVTVDATTCRVLAGYSTAKSSTEIPPANHSVNPLLRKVEAAMSFIAPLKLIDPQAPSFVPQACRSMHDIIRFAHEKAVSVMFSIGDRRLKRKKGARRLVGQLPMVIYVLDVGGGIHDAHAHRGKIHIEQVRCMPMRALWKGLLHPEIEWAGHSHFDWAEYDRLVMNGGIISPDSALLSSYAVVADRYLNFCLKFGYHFAIIDALFQQAPQIGHIWFRFAGGGGDPTGRQLRIQFLQRILTALGFGVKTEGELINARRSGEDVSTMADSLVRIGHLLGVTRLLDLHLKDEATVDRLEASFMEEQFADFNWESE